MSRFSDPGDAGDIRWGFQNTRASVDHIDEMIGEINRSIGRTARIMDRTDQQLASIQKSLITIAMALCGLWGFAMGALTILGTVAIFH